MRVFVWRLLFAMGHLFDRACWGLGGRLFVRVIAKMCGYVPQAEHCAMYCDGRKVVIEWSEMEQESEVL